MDTIREALEPVLRDVRSTTDVRLVVEDCDPPDEHSIAAMVRSDDGGTMVSVFRGTDLVEQVRVVAEQVQDMVIEELWARASNWPMCPAHRSSHPMQAEVSNGVPRWTCPADPAIGVAIGDLRL